jgi:hypothetical protein
MSEQESTCQFCSTCHFHTMKNMTPENRKIREIYCIEWPEKCEIYRAKLLKMPVSITLWPTGKLQV